MSSELHDIEYMTQYLQDGYKNAVKKKKREDDDRSYTTSMNALSSLGLAGAIVLGANGRKNDGLQLAAGVGAGALGYHGSRLLGGSPGVNLLAAATLGATGFFVEPLIIKDQEQ